MPAGLEMTWPLAGCIRMFEFSCSATDSVNCGGGGAAGAGGRVPGSVDGGSGGGGVPLPGGGSPGVEGVDAGTESDPREYEIVPSGSTQRIRQAPFFCLNLCSR